ncbi:MAG: type II secretion system F family protein, partial [Pseudomonadota bacterium]
LLGYLAVVEGLLKYNAAIVMAIFAAIGFMLPKWVLKQLASKRREKVVQELPLFVDLLRLLQGVGLSLDQSLQVMADDFEHVLKVLSGELKIANRQYSQGRSREHSLNRLATLYDNDSLAGLVALLIQVDRHGGAVQEPLHQFSERLRETRRSEMKARIGKITVKMTGVMVVTLLPALLIAVAGPGFLAVIRALGGIAK